MNKETNPHNTTIYSGSAIHYGYSWKPHRFSSINYIWFPLLIQNITPLVLKPDTYNMEDKRINESRGYQA